MPNTVNESLDYTTISASAVVATRPAIIGGIFVASGSGTLGVYDSATTDTSAPIVKPYTVMPGTFYPLPFAAGKGVYVVISGTMEVTVGTTPR